MLLIYTAGGFLTPGRRSFAFLIFISIYFRPSFNHPFESQSHFDDTFDKTPDNLGDFSLKAAAGPIHRDNVHGNDHN